MQKGWTSTELSPYSDWNLCTPASSAIQDTANVLNALLAAGMREIAGKIDRDGERQAFWKGTSHHAPPARGAHRKAAQLLPRVDDAPRGPPAPCIAAR